MAAKLHCGNPMFELYTDKARRVIFLARYEASMLGSQSFDTEHLLLGMLREAGTVLEPYLSGSTAIELIRSAVLEHFSEHPRIPTSVDMPLTESLKRALAAAAEESERLNQQFIGPEHLCLGILHEQGSLSATLLRQAGITADRIRGNLVRPGTEDQPGNDSVPTGRGRAWAPESFSYRLISEDGSVLHHIRWHEGRLARIPLIGEALEVESGEGMKSYRVLDVIWHVSERAATLFHDGDVVLRVRAE